MEISIFRHFLSFATTVGHIRKYSAAFLLANIAKIIKNLENIWTNIDFQHILLHY